MNQKAKMLGLLYLTLGLAVLAVPTWAHHGTNISYDGDNLQTVVGTVTGYRHSNPHPQLFVDVTDDEGKVTAWVFEIAPTPFTMSQNGWPRRRTMDAVQAGTVVTATFAPSRAGTPIGVLRELNDENGEGNLLGLARNPR